MGEGGNQGSPASPLSENPGQQTPREAPPSGGLLFLLARGEVAQDTTILSELSFNVFAIICRGLAIRDIWSLEETAAARFEGVELFLHSSHPVGIVVDQFCLRHWFRTIRRPFLICQDSDQPYNDPPPLFLIESELEWRYA